MASLELNCRLQRQSYSSDLSATLPLDGITALFGPSGSGKTMTLRLIAGLEQPQGGRISMDGEVWSDTGGGVDVAAHRRGAAMVFQDARLFHHLNVEDNLQYAVKRGFGHGAPNLGDVIEALDLGDLLKRRVERLSGGERQRVAIGRAIAARPRLLLMDEPLSALDLPRRAEVMGYIEALPAMFDIPIIYVTHAIDEVARLANSLALMDSGSIVDCGPVQDMLARLDLPPLTGRFEAGVVLEGKIAKHDEAYALSSLDIGGQELLVPKLDLAVGVSVRIRLRARDVAIARSAPVDTSIRNILEAEVVEVVPEPDTAYAEVRLRVGEQDVRARITRKSVVDLGLEENMAVYAMIKSVTLDRRMLTPGSRSGGQPGLSR